MAFICFRIPVSHPHTPARRSSTAVLSSKLDFGVVTTATSMVAKAWGRELSLDLLFIFYSLQNGCPSMLFLCDCSPDAGTFALFPKFNIEEYEGHEIFGAPRRRGLLTFTRLNSWLAR